MTTRARPSPIRSYGVCLRRVTRAYWLKLLFGFADLHSGSNQMAQKDLRWSGLLQQMSPSLTVLSRDQRQIIINTAFEILERTGNRVGSKEALELFQKAGCRIEPLDDEGQKVFFPQHLIPECLRLTPK